MSEVWKNQGNGRKVWRSQGREGRQVWRRGAGRLRTDTVALKRCVVGGCGVVTVICVLILIILAISCAVSVKM